MRPAEQTENTMGAAMLAIAGLGVGYRGCDNVDSSIDCGRSYVDDERCDDAAYACNNACGIVP